MSQGLKALEKICSQACDDRDELFYLKHLNCKKVEENECTGCLYCSGNENYKTIEKELKALEVIKNNFRLVGNCLHAKNPYAEDGWVFVKEIEDEEELDAWKEAQMC